ncbi:MAG TPA: hypothetical protein VFA04_06395 [Bryobacteraceae bacterium]|nr:hypothetical protein [Bryobacteraceae bacterium]
MRRRHWFELHDQTWFPQVLRDGITECLRLYSAQLHFERVIAPVLGNVLRQTGHRSIIDICSGSCGPVVPLQRELAQWGAETRITVTDKYPNTTAFRRAEAASGGAVRGCRDSVDAACVPAALSGVRTLFNAFHHFRPAAARAMLKDACDKGQPIAIFEITHRSLLRAITTFIGSALMMLLLVPRMRPARLEWWLYTYLIPVLPLAFGWDGMVSCLRTYTERDYRALTAGLTPAYSWQYGEAKISGTPLSIAFFVGVPAHSRLSYI